MGRRQRTWVRDDQWNNRHRSEAPLQRADRNFAELLQELRVAQTGGQILFGFLLSLSFTATFVQIDAFQRSVYVCALFTSAVTTMLLVAPVAAHRLLFQRGYKRELVHLSHRLAGIGFAGLAVTMSAGILLVVDVAAGRGAALFGTGLLALAYTALWLLVPLRVRRIAAATPCPCRSLEGEGISACEDDARTTSANLLQARRRVAAPTLAPTREEREGRLR